jgi:hypothetical protein
MEETPASWARILVARRAMRVVASWKRMVTVLGAVWTCVNGSTVSEGESEGEESRYCTTDVVYVPRIGKDSFSAGYQMRKAQY